MSSENDHLPMMDNNETELGLALGYSVPSNQTESNNNNNNNNNNDSGAGVNAGLSINIAFVASNPLSELVWSPSKGLSLKFADRSSAFLRDVGPSNTVTYPDHSINTKNSNDDENTIAKGTFITENNVDIESIMDAGFESAPNLRKFGGLFGSSTQEGQTQNDGNSVEVNTVEGVKDACLDRVKNEEESLSGPKNRQLNNFAETSKTTAGEVNRRTTNSLPLMDTASKPDRTSGNNEKIEAIATSSRPLGLEIAMDTQTQPVEELGREIQNEAHSENSGGRLERMESSAENNFRNERDDNDSNGSMESCSSRPGLFSNGKKRWGFEPPATISGGKKMKTQIYGGGDPTRRPDSSFMNWISTMVKGIPKSNQEQSMYSHDSRIVACNKTDDLASKTTGFRTIFQSLRNPDTKLVESGQLNEEKTGPSEIGGPSSMRPWFFPFKDKKELAENILESKSSDEKETENRGYANDPVGNLWITRFSAKTPILRNEGPSNESSLGLKKIPWDEHQDSTYRLNLIAGSQKLNSSGEMASIFAKRLDALKHIMSSDIKNDETQSKKIMTCFFCGRSGHGLRDCSEGKNTGLEDLLGRISSYDGTEQPQCFCIRCFQLDHWAITCPFVALSRQSKYNFIYDEKEARTGGNLKIMSDDQRENLDRKEISDAPKEMFDIMKKLRLTRRDILKCMRSGSSLSDLDGLFVRLRLGKYEGGLGGTGYHVACITGMERGNSLEESMNRIGVSVGGIRCLVETKYVSNHDFLEDELMAWWKITSKRGTIPCEAELKLKFEERKKLGL